MQNVNMGYFALAMVASGVCAYLLGSLSFATIISKVFYKKDVRESGSGNAGMTNMLRSFGKLGGALTLLGDALKGVAAVFLARGIMMLVPGIDEFFGNTIYGAYVAAICAILGHMFPLYFGFKGGKGIAVSLGVILSLQPVLALGLLAIFLVIVLASRMVSLGSIIAISLYPLTTLLWSLFVSHRAPVYSTFCALIMAGLVVYMHKENIQRLRAGTEYKFGEKKDTEAEEQ